MKSEPRKGELHVGTYPQGSRVEVQGLKSGMILVVVKEPDFGKKERIALDDKH